MSSLLEEALVDAAKLKEAAEQQATTELTEKYSQELNAKMSKILESEFRPSVFDEADDDDLGGLEDDPEGLDALGDDLGGGEEGEGFDFEDDLDFVDDEENNYIDDQVPYGFANEEDMCPCPEDEEEIEIDFNELVGGTADDGGGGGNGMDREEVMTDLNSDDEDYLEEIDLAELGIDEKMLEELAVDTEAAKSGWSPRPHAHWEEEIDQFLASLEGDTESEKTGRKDVTKQIGPADKIQDREEEESLDESVEPSLSDSEILVLEQAQKELTRLSGTNKKLLEENKELKKYNEKFSEKLKQAVKVLRRYHLENIKLEYQKSVVANASLNERQKNKLVEAISRAKSETEAETVFNLQESVVASVPKNELRTENPLERVLSRRPKPQISIRKQNNKQLNESNANPEEDRQRNYWQKLAGIKRQ